MKFTHGIENPRVSLNFQVSSHDSAAIRVLPTSTANEVWNISSANRSILGDEAFPALPAPTPPSSQLMMSTALQPPRVTIARTRTTLNENLTRSTTVIPNGQLARNQRLAEALEITRPGYSIGRAGFEEEMLQPKFSLELIEWGKSNPSYLATVERRLLRVASEADCYTTSLKPMPSEEVSSIIYLNTFITLAKRVNC
jgi:hypothetical protein